jgi:murein DD-endopeptidase MepM/ murein hydrolase activator NlpD
LTERGFVTQGLLEGGEGDHPGIDIAVPTDSYIRAAGSGRVLEAGEDSVYGQYILLDHGNGYETRYGHASMLLVAEGATVRRNEVIGLTGSTGQSTAPHLHFEVVRNGTAIDPLSMVERPG